MTHPDTSQYEDAIPGYNLKVNELGTFMCGCGQHHVFVPATRVIMWSLNDEDMPNPWYLECAFRYLLSIFDMV